MSRKEFGVPLENWTPPIPPKVERLQGAWATLECIDPASHATELFAANRTDDVIWDYLPYGPFETLVDYTDWLDSVASAPDPYFFAVRAAHSGRVEGILSLMRVQPEHGSIEVGHINFSTSLQRSRAATEALYLVMKWAFEAGYRRFEWKCDALNVGSRRAAQRFGFSYEGIFRQATLYKGRNRDTAWFAAIDSEWSALQAAYSAWLDPSNFDDAGNQLQSLSVWTAPILAARDPSF